MYNPTIKKLVRDGQKYLDTIDEYAKQAITSEMSLDLIFKIDHWALLSGSQLTLLEENVDRVKNLLSKNPAGLNALIFANKLSDYRKTQILYLKRLKTFVLLINDELLKKINIHPKIDTIYSDEDGFFIIKDGEPIKYISRKTEKHKIYDFLRDHEEFVSGTTLLDITTYKQKKYSMLNKDIKDFNKIAKEKFDLQEDLIIHNNQNGGFGLNRSAYNFN